MANATPSRTGQINGAGDALALFLKVFSGEVLTAFNQKTVTLNRQMVRSISSGKSAQFPVHGRATASYHTPGNELLGGQVLGGEKIINIDDVLVSDQFVSEIDELMEHYDVSSVYAQAAGEAMATQLDKHSLQVGVLAARTAVGNVTGLPGGSTITETVTGDWNDPAKLEAAAFTAAEIFDGNDVPESERYLYVTPKLYYTLVQSSVVNRDFGGTGSKEMGRIPYIAGFEIVKTNNLPSTNITGTGTDAGGSNARYVGDFTKTRGLFAHKSAMGLLKLMDLSSRADYDPRRLGTLLVTKYAVGHGILRPESAIELKAF